MPSRDGSDIWKLRCKVGISVIESLTGPLGAFIASYFAHDSIQVIERQLRSIDRRIGRLEERGRVDRLLADSPETCDLLKSSLLILQRVHRREKVECAGNIIVHSFLRESDKDFIAFDQLDFFVRVLERLSYGAIAVLSELFKVPPNNQLSLADFLHRHADSPKELPEAFLQEVIGHGFVHEHRDAVVSGSRQPTFEYSLTSIGRRFVEHVIEWRAGCEIPQGEA